MEPVVKYFYSIFLLILQKKTSVVFAPAIFSFDHESILIMTCRQIENRGVVLDLGLEDSSQKLRRIVVELVLSDSITVKKYFS